MPLNFERYNTEPIPEPIHIEWDDNDTRSGILDYLAFHCELEGDERIKYIEQQTDKLYNSVWVPGKDISFFKVALGDSNPFLNQLFTDEYMSVTTQDFMLRFERDYLKVPGVVDKKSMHWWASNAGFATGTYEAELLGQIVSVSGYELLRLLGDEMGWSMLKSDKFLIPIYSGPESMKYATLQVDGVMELSDFGEAYFRHLMRIGAYGFPEA